MKPLFVLLISFILAVAVTKFAFNDLDFGLAGRIALSVMLAFTAIAHFAFTKGMEMMVPGFIPFKKTMVYITGVIEIFAAIGLLIPSVTTLTAWFLILFLIILLPANIIAAIRHIDYQKATTDGAGVKYLWFRIPLQVFFIAWTYFFAIWLKQGHYF